MFVRWREDKQVSVTDVGLSQVLDRCLVPEVTATVEAVTLPESTVVRREVYTKEMKGKLAVRKLLVWKTNKEEVDERYPAYVVHWTDYSPNRKDPIKRTVKLAPDEEGATALATKLVEDGVKKGWSRADA